MGINVDRQTIRLYLHAHDYGCKPSTIYAFIGLLLSMYKAGRWPISIYPP
jgi:hypothetical protein